MRRTSGVQSTSLSPTADGSVAHSLASLLESSARHHQDRPALLAADRAALSHAQLWDHVSTTVRELNRLGVGRGDRVVLALPQGADLALTFLAVTAGATAVPLNPASSGAEFASLFHDLQPRALILPAGEASEARRVAGDMGVPVLDLTAGSGPGRLPQLAGPVRGLEGSDGFADPGDVALVLYTSGTTARPKRVPLTHANLLASLRSIGTTLRLGPDDRCLNVMPLFHIHGLVACLLASLGAGGSTVCTDSFDPDRFLSNLDQWKPSWYSAVPTIHQAILSRADNGSGCSVVSSLRLIRSSSAALPPPVMARLEAVFGVPVIESYGMTEASHQMASNPLPPNVRKPGSVGLAAGPEVAVLGPAGEVLSAEMRGEVGIRGPSVTGGYENLPAGAPDGFTQGWFRTGDQGYLDADGYLFLTGRLKELINRGGEKIAPREVDEVLLNFPGVAQAVAFAIPHPSLGEDIAAAVVPRPGVQLNESALREFAFEHLPAFKIPSRILLVEKLPVGASGKIQRIGLAERLAHQLAIGYETPDSPTEQKVAEVFAQVLEQPRIGRFDNFFSLGGDSLRAIRVLNRLQDSLGFNIPVLTLFRFPTPQLLAATLDRMRESEIDALAAELEKLSPEERDRLLRELPESVS
ncbi:MAG: hypothetical protein RIS76_58 [Verrucomicrobiota bacterium]|jgi:acyl-CoA synthetase (AMP-forming)/AMP-acid ligase II/acyl carrier protein